MRQTKVVLTSVLALVIASPAMAAVGDLVTSGAQCTIGDLGVSSGTANATAQFSVNSYNCAPGTYLPAGSGWSTDNQYTPYEDGDDPIQCMQCPANSFCYGSGDEEGGVFVYNQSSAQGVTSCSEEWGDGYPYSDAGSDNADACYFVAPCPTISAATACDPHAATCAYTNDAITTNGRIYAEGESGPNMPKCSLDFTCGTGYTKSTPGSAITAPNTNANSFEYKSHIYPSGSNSQNNSSLSAGEWSATWNSTGTIKGIASCNAVPGDNHSWAWGGDSSDWTMPANNGLMSNSADANDSSRRYCWCKPTSWTPSGGSEQLLSAAWVFFNGGGDASNCANYCAAYCADYVRSIADFRSALFGVVGASSQCVANTITLNWNNEDGTNFESGSCTYDESLTVPSTHPDKRGYTFTGWQFVSPSQN